MKEKVLEVLCQVNPKIASQADADLLETGLINSFEIVNVVMELEEVFQVEIDPELITPANFKNVDAITNMVEHLLK
ncbi:MAG: acyl carrier protein [Lachnospiraceae bacterium]|nr:acyl carrier protein [Lachnospiraceae bacterium]